MTDELTRITNLMADLDETNLLALVKERLIENSTPMSIIGSCRDGMQLVGERFAKGEYFVCDLVTSGELFKEVMELIGPDLVSKGDDVPKTKVVFGTVEGDIHNIGKNIVVSMLSCSGFEVYDLGVNVPPRMFVQKVSETGARVVGLSGLLTIAFSSMETTIKALRSAGLGDTLKIMIGGGLVDAMVCKMVGADAWGHDAIEAVKLAKSLAEVPVMRKEKSEL